MDQTTPQLPVPPGVPIGQPIARMANQPVQNPLMKHFRQPAIYMRLPTGGKYWKEGSLDMPENGEIAVYPMTTKDELILRTPDALLNGQGVIDVIQSCVPSIKNAWEMPSTDVDSVLISLRIASYGHGMDFESKCPHCGAEDTYKMDLRTLLETIQMPDFDHLLDLGQLAIKWRPQRYFDINATNQIQFEIQRIDQSVRDLEDSNPDKQRIIREQMQRLIDLNFEVLTRCTEYIIDTSTGTKVTDPNFIREFYVNVESKSLKQLQEQLQELVKVANVQPQKVNCSSCSGAIDLEILFDYANFFVVGF